ncbi:MAG: hypothetical protein Tsb008_17600 [Rhodothalassiaceae bacterium]
MNTKSERLLLLDSAEDLFAQGKEALRKASEAKTDSEKRLYADIARNYLEQGKKLTAAVKR